MEPSAAKKFFRMGTVSVPCIKSMPFQSNVSFSCTVDAYTMTWIGSYKCQSQCYLFVDAMYLRSHADHFSTKNLMNRIYSPWYCHLFTVSCSGLLFVDCSFLVPVILNFDLWPWATNLTYIMSRWITITDMYLCQRSSCSKVVIWTQTYTTNHQGC